MDPQLQTLIDLQGYDARIASLEAEAARLPKQIESIQASLAEAKKQMETLKARMDSTRKDLRAKEKDLEVIAAKRAKLEARLYEVKTNKEYSAALLEIEESKQEKAKAAPPPPPPAHPFGVRNMYSAAGRTATVPVKLTCSMRAGGRWSSAAQPLSRSAGQAS